MPRFATKEDDRLYGNAVSWQEFVDYVLLDIETWRDCVGERVWFDAKWPELPQFFTVQAQHLCAWMRSQNTDPSALESLHDAVVTWLREHDAAHVPPQSELERHLDAARLRLGQIEELVRSRLLPDSETAELSAQRESRPRLTNRRGVWEFEFKGRRVVCRNLRGMAMLAELLARPNEDVSCFDLAGRRDEGAAEQVMDDKYVQDMRKRASDAEEIGDVEKAEALKRELQVALNVHGRSRALGAVSEKTRKNVGNRIATALREILVKDEGLHRHLLSSIHNPAGLFVSYRPPADFPTWDVSS